MTHKLTYRDAVKKSDIEIVERLVTSTGVFNEAEVEIAIELVEDRLERGNDSEYFFVFAEENGVMLGYSCYGTISASDARYDLYWIAVDKTLHRRGIGRLLLAETEKKIRAAGGKRIYVETSSIPKYEPTRSFYAKSGYALASRLTDYYRDGDDLCIFMKSLE
jgi:ribosomal protein S18 acetylase RimI-like enzyme